MERWRKEEDARKRSKSGRSKLIKTARGEARDGQMTSNQLRHRVAREDSEIQKGSKLSQVEA